LTSETLDEIETVVAGRSRITKEIRR